ncbi:MAG: DUF805 domain-containing protein [Asticcacaulis sp.]|jgi:uncharacterized membrane protein YhaH (DUF805 family)|uniref:DUF805 domain-containing protein n=1 Tax=Asticcacaulis sp. TaxID=1872648 RepID=UPI0025C074E1|nr:DUF805 domain-containing protein [Asticcacaulis sp.]MCA1933980.1 DUF805 domain-containing protein [Asticcacaulis sp.]
MWRFLLSTKGRTARLPYALFMVTTSLIVYAISTLIVPMFSNIGMPAYGYALVLAGLPGLLLVWPAFALSARRLKDMSAPTWPALFFLMPWLISVVFIAIPFVLPIVPESGTGVNPEYQQISSAITIASKAGFWLSKVITLILCFIPGTKGPNRYGPPPGQKAAPDLSVFE